MFCNQCQESAKNTGCTIKGVCGKEDDTANIQDLLIYLCQGLSYVTIAAKKEGISTNKESRNIAKSLFTTITNANFDNDLIVKQIRNIIALRNSLNARLATPVQHASVQWNGKDLAEMESKATEVGVLSFDADEDIRSLKQYVLYGLKGMAAYAEHAANLGKEQDDIYTFIEEALVAIIEPATLDAMLALVIKTGKYGVKVMALLDGANTGSYGNPEITKVNIGVGTKPGILVSGHDLKDLEELLDQTAGLGIDIYTHSEMLPSHAYPMFKKHPHLVGNYGNAWHKQLEEFESFNGPILFTTNCLVPPRTATTYNHRVFTSGSTGMPQWKHIDARLANGQKDFSEIIALAKTCPAPTEIETGELTIGFAHNQVLSLADTILDNIRQGNIKKMVVMSGCDARHKTRQYYTDFAAALPKDTLILTSGCAKFRYNKLQLGDINGIPRVLDAGQCNDSYSWAVVAMKLQEVLGLKDINELPIVFNIAWYEQKAIIVHLALLYLGVKDTHIGPTLPAFMTPNVLKMVTEKFGVRGNTTVEDDMAIFELN